MRTASIASTKSGRWQQILYPANAFAFLQNVNYSFTLSQKLISISAYKNRACSGCNGYNVNFLYCIIYSVVRT